MKKCSRCNRELPADDFYRRAESTDGFRSWCKACDIECSKEYNERNRSAVLNSKRKYKLQNKEEVREDSREWRLANADAVRGYSRKYRSANKKKIKAQNAVYRAIEHGRILPPDSYFCFSGLDNCNGEAQQYHHTDYDEILDVIPVCRSCHGRVHASEAGR